MRVKGLVFNVGFRVPSLGDRLYRGDDADGLVDESEVGTDALFGVRVQSFVVPGHPPCPFRYRPKRDQLKTF